ncbi:hypothetical protein GF354_02205 [Candidatus Peregrinibacteria bacterium]|nr:hypothetical protein [Candidatus Peregrinibacteria bacterium]
MNSKKLLKNKGFVQFIIRLGIFIMLYVLAAYFYPDIKAYFFQKWTLFWNGYQALVIFYLILIFLYTKREKLLKLKPYKNSILQGIIFSALALFLLAVRFEPMAKFLGIENIFIVYFINFGLAAFFLFLAIFNLNFAFKKFFWELTTIISVIIVSYTLITIGPYYSELMVRPIQWGLELGLPYLLSDIQIIPISDGFILDFNEFRLNVLPACSGIYSFTAFTLLYISAVIFRKEQGKVNFLKAFCYWLIGVSILYILNIFRIFLITYLSKQVSQEFAIEYFHEYASSIFLLTLFIIYLYYVIPKIVEFKS